MPEISVNIEVWCGRCGEGLCHGVNDTGRRINGIYTPTITIEPCHRCLEEAYDKGFDKGHNEGYDVGVNDTKKAGE